MFGKYFLTAVISLFVSFGYAQEFRGIVSTKVYAEKGAVKVMAPFPDDLDNGTITSLSLNTRVVDTIYHSYFICSDTVFHIRGYDSEPAEANSAQIGPDFYLGGVDRRQAESYFKFRAPPSQLERANKGNWDLPKRKFRKQGYNSRWVTKNDPSYGFHSDIDTSISYGWVGHKQGLLNHLFPSKGIHRKVREDRKGSDVWIHEYDYLVMDTLSCDPFISNFQLQNDTVDIDDLFKGGEMTKDITPKDIREEIITFDAYDQHGTQIIEHDYKGTLTYIDIWASWCAPCLQEMSHLKKLKEHYSESDLKVISISIDEESVIGAWRKAMDRYKIDWGSWRVEDGFNSELCKEYQVQGIPRYILLDRDGKVMNSNAPRPSNPSIIEWIDELIQEL